MIDLVARAVYVLFTTAVVFSEAGGFIQPRWPPQGVSYSSRSQSHEDNKLEVPTISYNYQPQKSRLRHQSSNHWRERQGNYYFAQPKVEMDSLQDYGSVNSSVMRHTPTTGVFRTYGRGRAVVPYKGATIHVPKTFGPNKAYRGMISARVFEPEIKEEKPVVSRWRRDCTSCPKDEVVVASKGNAYVILPEPCSTRWQTISGPRPGSKLSEGVHIIRGTMGHSHHICQYKFEVKVRHCAAISMQQLNVTCTADNAWGSQCNFTCPPKTKLHGAAVLECRDSLIWSHIEPTCLKNYDCDVPNLEEGSKLNCQTNEPTDYESNFLSEGSYCKIKNSGKVTAIKCSKGEWVTVMAERKKKHRKKLKHLKKKKKYTDGPRQACERNPCQNGGTCLLSTKDISSYICRCPPLSDGPNCEFTQCETNICENDGQCLKLNGDTNCFCTPAYTGDLCQISQNTINNT